MMKLEKFKVGDDAEIFIERFDDYCNGMGLPNHLRANTLSSYLESNAYAVLIKELGEGRHDYAVVTEYMKKRFGPTYSSSHLRYNYCRLKQEQGESIHDLCTKLLDKELKASKAGIG